MNLTVTDFYPYTYNCYFEIADHSLTCKKSDTTQKYYISEERQKKIRISFKT